MFGVEPMLSVKVKDVPCPVVKLVVIVGPTDVVVALTDETADWLTARDEAEPIDIEGV